MMFTGATVYRTYIPIYMDIIKNNEHKEMLWTQEKLYKSLKRKNL